VIEAASGGTRAISRSWEAQHRLWAAVLPPLWAATTLAASLLLLCIGLRHLPRYRHMLEEAFRPHLSPRRSGTTASLLCLIPLSLRWGLSTAAGAYIGITHHELGSRERKLAILAMAWFVAMPAVWRLAGSFVSPIDPHGSAWLIDRVQREIPSPELEREIRSAARSAPAPEAAFAEGMLERRFGRMEAAAESFNRAIADGSRTATHARVNLGNLLFWKEDAAGAARCYEQVLDEPRARLEARYNLAIALSRLHRFREADARLEEAARLDLERVRSAVRAGDARATSDVMDGILSPRELWAIEQAASHRPPPVPPLVAWVLPAGRPTAAAPTILVSIILGAIAGALLRRRLRVHACHHCGAPVCRRCVTRSVGRAYCPRCAARLGSLAPGDYNRLLIRRLLGEERGRSERFRARVTYLLPGAGLVLRGRTSIGLALTWLFILGGLLVTRAAWSFPSSAASMELEGILRLFGALVMVLSAGISCAITRRVLRQRSLRHFFERDAYRAAA